MSRSFRSAEQLRLTLLKLMGFYQEHQPDVATALKASQGTVSNKLRGRTKLTLDDLDRLAAHYGITPADLLSGPEVAVTKSLAAKRKGGPVVTG